MVVNDDVMVARECRNIRIPVAAHPAEPRHQQNGYPAPVGFVMDLDVGNSSLGHDLDLKLTKLTSRFIRRVALHCSALYHR
jgi:hypothetical protein